MANIADIKTNAPVQWGREQEELLQGLIQTKARFENETKKPLICYLREMRSSLGGPRQRVTSETMAEAMIRDAGKLRDLLQPFDDGTRQTVSKKKTSSSGPGCPGR